MASGVGAPRPVRERQGNNNEQRNNTQSSPKLEFHQAMRDFKHMFPTLDDEIIEAVLRANNGLVDATIDQLLLMGAGSETAENPSTAEFPDPASFPSLPSYSQTTEPNEPPPAYTPRADEGQLLDLTETSDISSPPAFSSNPDITTTHAYRAWNPPMLGQLPVDFLRLDLGDSRANSNPEPVISPSSSSEQFLEDEKIALYLQNEEFMRELSRNKEFLCSLERDQDTTSELPRTEAQQSHDENLTSQEMEPRMGDMFSVSPSSEEDFKEKLKHMGKSTRRKFNQLARVFSRKKRPINVTTVGGTSTANLLQEYEDDSDDDDDDELLRNHERLEPLEESDSGDEEGRKPQQSNTQSTRLNNEPVEFFAEDNEFQFKHEGGR